MEDMMADDNDDDVFDAEKTAEGSGGTPLQAQKMRNALHLSSFQKRLTELNENKIWVRFPLFLIVFSIILSILVLSMNAHTSFRIVKLSIKSLFLNASVEQRAPAKFLLSKDSHKLRLELLQPQHKNRLSLHIKLDKYNGNAYGTVLDLYNTKGRYLSIGFTNQFNSHHRAAPTLLQILSKNDNELEIIRPLGKPSSNSHFYYLFAVKNSLFAVDDTRIFAYQNNEWIHSENSEFLSVLRENDLITNNQYDELLKEFCNWNKKACFLDIDVMGRDVRFGRFYISEKKLLFSPHHITRIQAQYPKYRNAKFRPIYYWSNRVVLIFKDNTKESEKLNGVASCLDHNVSKVLSECNFINLSSRSGLHHYAIGGDENELVVNFNDGNVVKIIKDNNFNVIRRADDKSFQVYSYINADNNKLFGEYPYGDLLTLTEQEYSLVTPRLPIDAFRLASLPELQSLSLYGMEIYGGLWPWGQVWKTDGLKWHYVNRLFNSPPINNVEYGPYEISSLENGVSPINLFGQRITSIIPFGNDILLSTAMKNNSFAGKEFPINGNILAEYGKIYSLNKPGNFAYDISPLTSFTLELVMDEEADETNILIDGKNVGALGTYININKSDKYTINTGLFGNLRGSAWLSNHFFKDVENIEFQS